MQLGLSEVVPSPKSARAVRHGTTRREGVGFVEAVETRGKLLLSLRCSLARRTAPPAAGRQAEMAVPLWKEVR